MRNSIIPSEGAAISILSDSAGGRLTLLPVIIEVDDIEWVKSFLVQRGQRLSVHFCSVIQSRKQVLSVCVSDADWVFRDALWWYTVVSELKQNWNGSEIISSINIHKKRMKGSRAPASQAQGDVNFYLSSVFHIPA